VPSSAHNGMQRKCSVHAADSSRAECTRYVTWSARSRSSRLWKQIAMNERSRIYRWAVAWQRDAPAKGRATQLVGDSYVWPPLRRAKVAGEAGERARMYVCVCIHYIYIYIYIYIKDI